MLSKQNVTRSDWKGKRGWERNVARAIEVCEFIEHAAGALGG